ncbi:RNA-directed DNA polymerase, eukaryota [Artemisia annua]|uniref:RNA-directed DNA polymerase, eukaryota n=1 Tax=Artemisia annua TaxID=35608 RepID=A0A2U1PN21_ARTAN|nr:RNA-directed DNA polymerase, eukaryota [Artemisia annua]
MEGLHVAIEGAVSAGLYRGIKVGDASLHLTHLFYADDVIFLGEWNRNNIVHIIDILHCFHLVSGLQINLHKSNLPGLGVPANTVDEYAQLTGCQAGKFPFVYLGLPVGANMSRNIKWKTVIDRFTSKLSSWKEDPLNPMENDLGHKESGGLDIGSLEAFNKALILKWIWRFYNDNQALWVDVVKSIYGEEGGLGWTTGFRSRSKEAHDLTFPVKQARCTIDHHILPIGSTSTLWNRFVPRKVNIFFWRCRLNRLPTRVNLDRKGLDVPSILYSICASQLEYSDHIFFLCPTSHLIWKSICKWCDSDFLTFSNVADMITWVDNAPISRTKTLLFQVIVMTTCWVIWKFKNASLFDLKRPRRDVLIDSIVDLSFSFFIHRNRKISSSWSAWLQNPLLAICL